MEFCMLQTTRQIINEIILFSFVCVLGRVISFFFFFFFSIFFLLSSLEFVRRSYYVRLLSYSTMNEKSMQRSVLTVEYSRNNKYNTHTQTHIQCRPLWTAVNMKKYVFGRIRTWRRTSTSMQCTAHVPTCKSTSYTQANIVEIHLDKCQVMCGGGTASTPKRPVAESHNIYYKWIHEKTNRQFLVSIVYSIYFCTQMMRIIVSFYSKYSFSVAIYNNTGKTIAST